MDKVTIEIIILDKDETSSENETTNSSADDSDVAGDRDELI